MPKIRLKNVSIVHLFLEISLSSTFLPLLLTGEGLPPPPPKCDNCSVSDKAGKNCLSSVFSAVHNNAMLIYIIL